MTHWGVSAGLLSCASALALGGAFAPGAAAHPYASCRSITHPTTIDHDKKCVRVTKTIAGDVVNDAKIGKPYGEKKPAFVVGNGGLITGELVNNGTILGGGEGTGALTLGRNADVQGGIFNNGTIASKDGSGISLGYLEHDHWHHWPQAAAMTGDIVNAGLVAGGDYGLVARHGTMSGALINEAGGTIVGGKIGVFIPDSFGEWSGGIQNAGLIYGEDAGIQIGGRSGYGHGGEDDGVVFSGGIFNLTGGVIAGKKAPSIAVGGASFSGGVYNDGLITQYLSDGGEGGEGYSHHYWGGEGGESHAPYEGVGIVVTAATFEGGIFNDVNGEIDGMKGPAIWITDKTENFAGGIANNGIIAGADDAVRIESAAFEGGLYNGPLGSIAASEGDAIFATSAWTGDVVNHGLISGAHNGFTYLGSAFDGSFANTGVIEGGNTGVTSGATAFIGGFTNSGSITGEIGDGVAIDVDAWGAAETPADIVNTAGGVITGGETGFLLDVATMHGDFLNDGRIEGGGANTGVHIVAGDYFGDILNNGTIEAPSTALVAEIALLDGGFANTGAVEGGETGARFVVGEMTGGFTNDGAIEGGGTGASFKAENFDGPFANSGAIAGGVNGVVMMLGQAHGGLTNAGSITGEYGNGVDIVVTAWGTPDARADIVNTTSGVVTGGETGFLLDVGTMHGDFVNDGQISGGGENTGVHIVAGGYFGDILNNGTIEAPSAALVAEIETLDGAFANSNTIAGGATGVELILGHMTGGFANSGSITGDTGNGVEIIVDTWGSEEARVAVLNTADGVISGGETGFALDAGALHGAFTNDGEVTGGVTGAAFAAENFDAPFANSGIIAGGTTGVVMMLGQASGGLSNGGSIAGAAGNGVDILVTTWGSEGTPAGVVNTAAGTIAGGANGLVLDLVTFHGDVANDGLIEGENIAALLTGGLFDGAFANTGDVEGGATGVALILETATGGFTNSGAITGSTDDGVAVDVGEWGSAEAPADIVNTAAGVIAGGETGFLLNVGEMHGDFLNDGRITGGGETTGVHIVATDYFGDILNNGTIDAPSNALAAEIETLDGEIRNTGTIAATGPGGVAAALNIGNGTTFTNAGGGLILGDVIFGGEASYGFVGEDGGVEGDLIGADNDDTIAVRDGTQYFVLGTAGGFASFTVEGGGAAIVGARFEGEADGAGYAFANVDQLTVENGGVLYVDKSSTLAVDGFTQQAGGTVEFYLGAPGGDGFSDLTGSVVAGPEDYGRILVDGPVTLDGAVVGFLDPAFAEANPDLDEVRYEDVIVAGGGISGGFSTVALIADSSLFELDDVIDGNTLDMRVVRTSLSNIGDVAGIVVNTGGPFDAMVSDRSNGLGSGSCGLAGDGWCFNRLAANEPGSTQVLTDAPPVDPFAWLRTGYRQVGETAAWGRAIGAWGETHGDAGNAGSEFEVAGAIVGVDHVFSPIFMAGLAAQWTTTELDFVGRPDNADVDSFEAGGYLSWGDTRLYLNANASAIWHSIEVNRFTPAGRALGDYDGTTISTFAETGKTFETEDGARIQPFLALSYSHLETDAYGEIGTGTLLDVSGSEFDSLKSTVGVRLAYPIALESGRKMVPEARMGWTHEFMDDQASFVATIQGQQPAPTRIFGEKFARDTLILGGGVNVPLAERSTAFVDYDAGLNPDITTHTVSAGVRVTW